MLPPDKITSAQNPKIKDLVALGSKSALRKERGLFIVEGLREYKRAVDAGYLPETVFVCDKYCDLTQINSISGGSGRIILVSDLVYDKIAYRGGTEGVVAVMHTRHTGINDITLSERPFVIVLESVEKPGNLGAVLRTADAAGADAVIVCDPLTDLYNPNIIRSSVGGIFSVQTAAGSNEEVYQWIKSHNINILTAQLQDSVHYYDTDMKEGVAIVFGSEDKGLTPFWRERSDAKINIPMLGKVDSLNISISAAVLCYEVVRQRNS